MEKELFKFSDPITEPYVPPVEYAKNATGMFRTVAAVPTAVPKNFLDQIQYYKSGATLRIYIYDKTNNVWSYAALT